MNIQGFNPAMAAPVQAQTASGAAAMGRSPGSTSSTSSSSLQATFLNLLVTELQNQDPTSPVDPTQMVSQMVSLNQLDQLISINQLLTNMSSSTTPQAAPGSGQPKPVAESNTSAAAYRTAAAFSNPISAPAATLNQLPAAYTGIRNASGLMNLYGSNGVPGAGFNSNFAGGR